MDGFHLNIIGESMPELMTGAYITLKIATVSFCISLVLGTATGIARSRPGLLKKILTPYVEIFRGTPLLIQLFFIYYALPVTGLSLDNLLSAYIGMGLCGGAYISEIVRAALASIDKGQEEAAMALGLSRLQILTLVLMPQAARIALPPLMNAFSSQLKETSLVSVLAINELTRMGQMVYSRTFRPFEIYLAVGVFYFIMTYAASLFSRYLERRLNISTA